jgi:hypothetical protein
MSTKVKTNNHSNYNPALDQYSNVDLFPEKTKRAKEALSKPGVLNWLKNIDSNKKEDGESINKP